MDYVKTKFSFTLWTLPNLKTDTLQNWKRCNTKRTSFPLQNPIKNFISKEKNNSFKNKKRSAQVLPSRHSSSKRTGAKIRDGPSVKSGNSPS